MRSNRDSEPEAVALFQPEWNTELDEKLDALEFDSRRRSCRVSSAARRSIEQYQEQRHLKRWLTDVFDEAGDDSD